MSRPMKTRQRLVGSYVDSAARIAIDPPFQQSNVSPNQWNSKVLIMALLFLGCLAMGGLGL